MPALFNHGHRFATYEIQLEKVEQFFSDENGLILQTWNQDYEKAKLIFGDTHVGHAARMFLHRIHNQLYSNGVIKTETKKLLSGEDFLNLIDGEYKVKQDPRFTYVILPDGKFRFSRTEHLSEHLDTHHREEKERVVNFFSKHACHANAAEKVLYAGEFEILRINNQRTLVINNSSGTYGPKTNRNELKRLKELLEENLPGLPVISKNYKD